MKISFYLWQKKLAVIISKHEVSTNGSNNEQNQSYIFLSDKKNDNISFTKEGEFDGKLILRCPSLYEDYSLLVPKHEIKEIDINNSLDLFKLMKVISNFKDEDQTTIRLLIDEILNKK